MIREDLNLQNKNYWFSIRSWNRLMDHEKCIVCQNEPNHDLGLVLDKLNSYRENSRPSYDEIPKICGYVAQLVRAQHS